MLMLSFLKFVSSFRVDQLFTAEIVQNDHEFLTEFQMENLRFTTKEKQIFQKKQFSYVFVSPNTFLSIEEQ